MYRAIFYLCCLYLVFAASNIAAAHATEDSDKKDYIELGGAVHLNVASENYEADRNTMNTFIKLDELSLTIDSRLKGIDLGFKYMFYPQDKMHFLQYAYIGYSTKNFDFKFGVFEKPFGIVGTTAHTWWLQLPYYVGFEDTYMAGLGATYRLNKFNFDLAYFRQAAPSGSMSTGDEDSSVGNSRYSYAIIDSEGADIRELDQFNARIQYQVSDAVEIGLSGQVGGIYNRVLNSRKWAYAGAAHLEMNYERWNLKSEIIGYNYRAQDNEGNMMSTITMASYACPHEVATKGIIYAVGLSYEIPFNRKFLQSIRPYLDYSLVQKSNKAFHDTHMIIPGVLISAGPLHIHVDYAFGKNNPVFTSYDVLKHLGEGERNARWNSCININISYQLNFKKSWQ